MTLSFIVNTELSPHPLQLTIPINKSKSSYLPSRLMRCPGSNLPCFFHADLDVRLSSGSPLAHGIMIFIVLALRYIVIVFSSPHKALPILWRSQLHKREMSEGRKEGTNRLYLLKGMVLRPGITSEPPGKLFLSSVPRPYPDKAELPSVEPRHQDSFKVPMEVQRADKVDTHWFRPGPGILLQCRFWVPRSGVGLKNFRTYNAAGLHHCWLWGAMEEYLMDAGNIEWTKITKSDRPGR